MTHDTENEHYAGLECKHSSSLDEYHYAKLEHGHIITVTCMLSECRRMIPSKFVRLKDLGDLRVIHLMNARGECRHIGVTETVEEIHKQMISQRDFITLSKDWPNGESKEIPRSKIRIIREFCSFVRVDYEDGGTIVSIDARETIEELQDQIRGTI